MAESPSSVNAIRSEALCLHLCFFPKVIFTLINDYDYFIEGVAEITIPIQKFARVRDLGSLSDDRLIGIVGDKITVWDIKTGRTLWIKTYGSATYFHYNILSTLIVICCQEEEEACCMRFHDSVTYALINETKIRGEFYNFSHMLDLDDGTVRFGYANYTNKFYVHDYNRYTNQACSAEVRVELEKQVVVVHVTCLSNMQIVVECVNPETHAYCIRTFECFSGQNLAASPICCISLPQIPNFTDVLIQCRSPVGDGMFLGGSSSELGYIALLRKTTIVEIVTYLEETVVEILSLSSERILSRSRKQIAVWNVTSRQKEFTFSESYLKSPRTFTVWPNDQLAIITLDVLPKKRALEVIDVYPGSDRKRFLVIEPERAFSMYAVAVLPRGRLAYCTGNAITVLR